jgi:Omp85 superfamily domain
MPDTRTQRAARSARLASAWAVLLSSAGTMMSMPVWPQDAAPGPGAPPPAPTELPASAAPASAESNAAQPAPPGDHRWAWLNPTTLPFIPIPEIGVDPNSGTTLGILPVWLHQNSNQEITRIIAPDAFYNPYFGWGAHARIFEYPSPDEIWSVVAGIEARVQRGVDGEFDTGLLREQRWSLNASLIYDRSGTPRFYGVGNQSPAISETDYTEQQELAQWQIGLNFNQAWQLQYSPLIRSVDVLPGTLAGIATLQTRFAHILGEGTTNEIRHRLSLIHDTRDSLFIPTHGIMLVAYGGVASRQGFFNDSLYTEAGFDGRGFWRVLPNTILAGHMALRYLPETHDLPFWALSGIGGGESQIGGEQILRGFGAGRFYDRDSFAANLEMRNRVASFTTFSSRVDLEITPFVDVGRVFPRPSVIPLTQLHTVGGIGFRGVAQPSVVGRVDIGYGSEGLAVFTGLNYPF